MKYILNQDKVTIIAASDIKSVWIDSSCGDRHYIKLDKHGIIACFLNLEEAKTELFEILRFLGSEESVYQVN